MRIAVASDHAGFLYKEEIKKHLEKLGHDVFDAGAFSLESTHYPLYAFVAARKVASGEAELGVLVCSSGEGVMIAANKVKGIRAGIGYNDDVAHLMREHNDANMIAFGQKFMVLEDVLRRVDIFLSSSFEGGRHSERVDQIKKSELK